MNKLKVCFVGSGSIGVRHIKNLFNICQNRNIKLQLDILRSTFHPLQEDIKMLISNIYRTVENIDVYYDMIFITNPTYLHYETIKALKNHAKYFFVEKPVFCNGNESISDLELPDGNIYYVACPLRYTNILQKAKSILSINKPISVRVISSSYLPAWRPNVDYRNTYSAHRKEGGGVCIDLIHEWDYLIWLFGVPSDVKAFSGKYSDLEIDSDDLAIYIVQYDNFLAEVHLDYFGHSPKRTLEVHTKNACYVFDIMNNSIFKNGILIYENAEDPNDKYIKELECFLNIFEKNIENLNDLHNAVQTLKFAVCKEGGSHVRTI